MALRRFVNKLPGVLQTEVQKEFYAATFDQLFNPANVEAAQGFIGRRTGDVLDPLQDNYLEEPTKNRAAYQLEPIAYAVNAALEDTNQFFYEDILNYIRTKGGNIENHDRLFADNYYSFAPPIDVDKYLNYQNYLWLDGDGSDPSNTAPIGFLLWSGTGSTPAADFDATIESLIIGAETFNTSKDSRLVPQNFEFTSGMRIQFVGSASYNKPFYIEGVGREIRLVEEESVVYPSTEERIVYQTSDSDLPDYGPEPTPLPDAAARLLETPDYITVERGSVEGSAWSRSNRWFHEDSVDAITQLGQLQGGTIIQGGNGYDIGDVLLVNIGDGTGGSFVVTSVALGGVIDGIAVFSRGSGYNFAIVDETGVISPITELAWDNADPFGLGSAWDPDNVIVNPSAYLTTIGQDETDFNETIIGGTVALGGNNYTVGDTLTIVGGTGTPATFNVDTVDPVTGAVTGISLISSGSYTAIPTTPAGTTGGTGLGCTINLRINGSFDGGSAFLDPGDVGKYIALNDGTIVQIDAIVANVITQFTIIHSSSIPLAFSGQTLTMGGVNASIRVTTNGSGQIDSAKIVDRGAGYHTGGVVNLNNTLGGAGGQLTYTVSEGRIDTISVSAVGAGYTADSVSFVNALDIPAATSTDANGTGFELNLATANERGVTLWDDNTITAGGGAGAYIEGSLAAAVSRSNKAERPILEFKRDLDMFDQGWRYLGSVDVAAVTEDFGDVEGQPTGLQVDGVTLTTGMRLIFLDPDTIVQFLQWDESTPLANDYTDLNFTAPDTIVRTGGTAFDSELSPGDFITITNAVIPGNNGTWEVFAVNSTTITVVAPNQSGDNLVTDAVDTSAFIELSVPPSGTWDVPGSSWESSGSSGAITRFVWEVDATGPTISLSKYDMINDIADDVNVEIGDVVTVTSGDTWAGYDFYSAYDDDRDEFYWRSGQQKFTRNQPMLYSLYDTSGINLADSLEYPDSNFTGSEIFSYKVLTQERLNELGGGQLVDDTILGFPLETKGFRQLGDVIFENDLETQRYDYTPVGESETEIRGYYYFRQYIVDIDRNVNPPASSGVEPLPLNEAVITVNDERYQTNWLTSSSPEEQRVIDRYLTTSDTEDIFPVSVAPPVGSDACLVVAQGRRLNTSEFAYLRSTQEVQLFATPIEYDALVGSGTTPTFTFDIQENFQLTVDGVYQELGVDYVITADTPGAISVEFSYIPAAGAFIQATNRPSGAPGENQVVEILTCTFESLPDDSIGYFEIPNALENNPNNLEIEEQSWNEFTPHFTSIITEQDVYEGDAFGAGNNYRDTAKDGSLGTFALQSQAPLLKTMLCASNNDLDIVDSIRFSSQEYTRFKAKYVKTAQQLINEGYQALSTANPIEVSQWVDEILRRITRGREYADAFSDTYMIAWNNVYQDQEITAPGLQTVFTTTNFVDLSDKRNVLYVYVDGVIQLLDRDYEIINDNPIQIELTEAPALGAELVIRLFENSAPAHIPATPTKLGLYPAYRPRIEVDNTYLTPAEVIIGHDGSRTPVYGSEIDDLLLELETRIYNGIIDKFRVALESGDVGGEYNIPLKVDTYKPGKFRTTRWDLDEWNDLIKQSFFKWSATNKTDYITNNYYDNSNEWTYNYGEVLDGDGVQLPSGYWRGIFDYYYDTQTPESTPWEMLGFTEKPIWWEACTPRIGDRVPDDSADFTGYGPGPYPSDHFMWIDIEAGLIRRVYDPVAYDNYITSNETTEDSPTQFPDWVSGSIDTRYARPGLVANYLPVDITGALKSDPLAAIDVADSLVDPTAAQAQEDYVWGDWAPIEYAWRTSESYPFAAIEALFLARPGEFGEQFWDPEHIYEVPVDREQVVNNENDLRKRISNDELYVHGETLSGVMQVNTGYQVWITNRLRTLKKDPDADFGALVRTLDVKLGHKMAGFTDKDTLRVFVEGISVSSAATNLLVPSENIDVALFTGAPSGDYFYGGVLIKALDDNTYQIFGYDILRGEFEYYERNDTLGTSTVNVGGDPESFRVYSNGDTYQAGEIIKLNGIFYRAKETHESTSFDPDKWTKLQSLPITGGISVTHKPNNTGNLLTLKYGEKLIGPQAMFDFLIGWGDYLEEQGWTFKDLGANGEINDWYKVAKDYLLWTGTQWEPNSIIMLSPGGEKTVLNALEGYPGNVERIRNGVYSILNKEGVAIDPANTVINRVDRLLEVEPSIDQTGIYGLRVSTFETESIVTFDNVTVFNDILYDPVLGNRLARLDFRGRRTLDWTGKLEAAGFIITADGLLPNYENMVDSIRNYHNTEVQLDTPELENTARHLIGFDERDYFIDLGVLDDAQFQFYQGLVRQKGTRQAIEKLERNALVTSIEDELNVIEEWALKIDEFGGVCKNQFTEFLIAASEVKVDPQLVQLSYPASNSEVRTRAFASTDVSTASDEITINGHGFRTGDGKTYSAGAGTAVSPLIEGTVYFVVVVDENTIQLATTWANATAYTPTTINIDNAGTGTSHTFTYYPSGRLSSIELVSSGNVYTIAPNIFISNHPDDLTGSGASATAILDTDGTLLRIDVLNPGSGYSEPPTISIGSPSIVAGADRALARIEFDIATDIASDDVILIDIDDETRWITKPAGTACDVAAELWPEAPEEIYRTTNAGYVHKDDITFTAFNREAVDDIINNTTTAFEQGQTIWMARDPRETFGVYYMDNYKATLIEDQTELDFDAAGDNGTFSGGTGYAAFERLTMSDGSEIIVDAVSGGVITEFTIDNSTNNVVPSPFPARGSYTLTTASSTIDGNNDFTLTVGTNNEGFEIVTPAGGHIVSVDGDAATITMTGDGTATLTSLPREDVIKAQFTIDVSGTPTGDVTGVTIVDGGFGYKSGGTFTISTDTYGDERTTNDTDAVITYTVSDGVVDSAVITEAGSGYARNVATVAVNAAGSTYSMNDSLTLVGGTTIYGAATFDVTELTTIAAQDETNFDSTPANEGSFAAGTGHAAGDVITLSDGSTVTVDAASISTIKFQTNANFDGVGSNGTYAQGSGYILGDFIALQDGTVLQVTSIGGSGEATGFKITESTSETNINSGDTILQASTSGGGSSFSITLGTNNEQTTSDVGLVSNFTITTASTTGITTDNATLTQTSTDGLGVNFSITLGTANQGVRTVVTSFKGSYSTTTPGTTGVATTVLPANGSGCTLDLTYTGTGIVVDGDDVTAPIGWGRYLGNSVPGSGSIFVGGALYDYEITTGLNVNLTKDGEDVEEDAIADATPFYTLMNVRYEDTAERLLFADAMQFSGVNKVWTDDNGSDLWVVSNIDDYTTVTSNSASAVLTVADNVSEGTIVGYEGLPDVIVPEPFVVDIDDGTTTETFTVTMFNDHGQGSGFEIELTDLSAPYNSPLFENIASIEINHVGETGFDINSASLENSFDASTLNSPFASFGEYGFKMYVIDPSTNGFRQYSLSTAFDTTTATLDGSYDIDTAEAGMQFGFANQHETLTAQRGQSFYTFGTTSNRLRRWFTPTDWDLSTATPDTWLSQSEDVSGWTQTPNLNGGAFFILDRGVGVDMYWLDGANTQIQHWANKLNEIQDVTQAGKAANIDLSTLTNFNWGFPRSMTMADGGNKLIILDDNYNSSGNSYLCEIPLNTRNDPSSFSASAPEKTRLLSNIYGTETAYQPHISGYYNEKYFILCGDSTDRILTFNAAVPTPSPLVLNTIDVGSGGDLDHGGSTEASGYLYMWFPTSGGYWGNDDIGLSYSITINSGDPVLTPTLSSARTEEELIETDKFANAYVYEEATKDTLAQIPVYDPFKGILPGTAAQNIKYIRQRDPARYSYAVAEGDTDVDAVLAATRLVNADLLFDGDQLGQLWWDTSTSAYVYYEQGTDTYRRDNWGKFFPGSSVDIYEWTRSTDTPDNWDGDGTVRSETEYVQKEEWDPILEEVRTFYYFWVKDRTEIPEGVNRTVAAFEVANILTNPVANLYQWFSPISQSGFMFAGVDNVFTDSNNIFQINYTRADDERPTHVEWELGRDSDASYEVNDIHWNKMVDSLCGFTDEIDITAKAYTDAIGSFNTDNSGIDTPAANQITTLEPHGFTNGMGGVYSKNGGTASIGLTEGETYYVEVISDNVFALHAESQQAYPIPPVVVNPATRLPVSISGAEVHTIAQPTTALNNFANAIPTAADETKGYLVVPDPSLSTSQQLGIRIRPMQSMFSDIQDARRVWRDKVNELTNDLILRDLAPTWNANLTTNNLWEWVDWYADGYDQTNTVPVRQVEDTSDLAFLEDEQDGDIVKVVGTRYSIYEYDSENDIYNLVAREASRLNILEDVYTSDPTLEIAIELREIIQALRDNVFVGDLFVYNNSIFFALLNYVFSEQDDLDWAFKTTYIFLDQTGRQLTQERVFQEDPFDAALEYITEAKPFHSKIRDFRITRETVFDTATGTADETARTITPFLVYDQIRGGDLSVTEMRIAKYMMSLDTSWKGYTTLYDLDGSSIDVRLGAAGRAVNNYREYLVDIQGPSGGTQAEFDVLIDGAGLLSTVTITNPGSGYTDGTGLTFFLLTTQGGGDFNASISYDVVNGQVTNAFVDASGSGYTPSGGDVPVDASDIPVPNTGTTIGEFNPIYTGVATTDDELLAVATINAAITEEFFFDYQGSLLINTSFGGLPTLESFALVLDEEGNTAAGTGYVIGEILALDAGSGVPVSNALIRVDAVTGSGGITAASLVSGGSYTQTPTVDPVDLNGGSGSSAQVTTLIFENGAAIPWDTTPYDQIGFESSPEDPSVLALTGSPDGFATTIPGQSEADYDGTGENGSFVAGASYLAGAANGGVPYPSGLTFADNAPALDTIARSDGNSFVTTDGMEPGMQIIISNANTASNNGTYTIDSVTDTVITLTAGSQVISDTPDTTATFTFHDVIEMTDGSDIRVDVVDGGGAVQQFTIINGSESFLPVDSTITQLSVSGGTGSDFQLTLGDANETSGTFADVEAEEQFSGTGNQKEFTITTDVPTYFMFAVVDDVQQVLNVDYFFIGDTLKFVSILDTNGQRAFGAPPAGTNNVELYTYIEAGDLINPQVTEGITEEMVPLDPRENLVLLADTTSVVVTSGGTGYEINDEVQLVGGTRLQSTIAAQTEVNFDGAGSNGTFDGGLNFRAGDTIRLVDTTEITVDTVDANGTVTEFTIDTASGRGFLTGSVINQDSTTNSTTDPILENGAEWDIGSGFQLLPGTNNEANFGNPMTIRVDSVTGGPPGAIATFTVLDQGDYYTYPTSPVSVTDTVGGGNNDATFTLATHSFRLHNDTLNNLLFTRNATSASTTLRANVGTSDNVIPVAQGENLYTTAPSRTEPQIAWIGTERIVYHGTTATKEATFTIDTDGAGVVSAVTLVNGGTGYTDGTGFTFTVTTATGIAGNDDAVIAYDVSGGIVTNPTVSVPGTGYTLSQTGVAVSAADTNDPDVAVWELTGVIRGTGGTHPQLHFSSDKVYGTEGQDIPVSPYTYWVNTATAGYGSGTFDGEWRYHGNNLIHFVLENTAPSTAIHTDNSIVVGDTLRCTSGSYIQNSYFIKDLILVGEVSRINIDDPGTGYSKGDVISTGALDSALTPTSSASLVVQEVDSTGAILVVGILDRGTGYTSGNLNFSVLGGDGNASITVWTDREGLALAQGGDIVSAFGITVSRNNVSWATDRALPGGLLAATTTAATFIQAEAGNALPVPAS